MKTHVKPVRLLAAIVLVLGLLLIFAMPAQANTYNGYPYSQSPYHDTTRYVGADGQGYYISQPSVPYWDRNRNYDPGVNYWHRNGSSDYNVAPVPNAMVIQSGSVLYGRNIYDQWVMLTSNFASNLQVQGERIGMIDSNHYLFVKEGIYGQWMFESSNSDEYWLTSSILVERVGTCVFFKARFDDNWVQMTSNAVPGSVYVIGNSITYTPMYPEPYYNGGYYR